MTKTTPLLALLLLCAVAAFFRWNEVVSNDSNGRFVQTLLDPTISSSEEDDLVYYNIPGKDPRVNGTLPYSDYPDGGAVIAFLASSYSGDVTNLQTALRSMALLEGDKKRGKPLTPVLVFNEADFSEEQISAIIGSTNHPIAFPTVDLLAFPEGWDPEKAPKFLALGRKDFGYPQMIRFWITLIWTHPAIERFGTVMRLDSDSCFLEPNPDLPYMAHDHIVYHSYTTPGGGGLVGEFGQRYLIGLYNFTKEYLQRENIVPSNPEMWDYIEDAWENHHTLCVFQTNLEVSSKAFMQREDVMKWHNALTEHEPFGVFQFRWGDAITRFLTAAIFATEETIDRSHSVGYNHKHTCSWENVEEALKQNGLL